MDKKVRLRNVVKSNVVKPSKVAYQAMLFLESLLIFIFVINVVIVGPFS